MIESFMLAANETVAKHYDLMHVPFLYRIHEHPDTERIKTLPNSSPFWDQYAGGPRQR